MMGYFITNISFDLLVKIFKIGEVTGKMVDCVIHLICVCPQSCRTRQISKITCV